LDLLNPLLAGQYCLITVIDSSPGITHSVGERLISKGHNARLVSGGFAISVSDLLELPENDQFLNEFDEMYVMEDIRDTDAAQLERFPGERPFEDLRNEERNTLALQMQRLRATMFLSDGDGVNCAFVQDEVVRLIQGAGFDFIRTE